MIRIEKPRKAPRTLADKGATQTQKDCDAYDLNPGAYHSGSETFEYFDRNIYGARSVRNALSKAQHYKCCYCECWLNPPRRSCPYGNVEHFRPKGAVQQSRKRKVQKPGYYWLACDWDNLLLSCGHCNSKKGSLFPLKANKDRARTHHTSLESEQPLIINPATEDPREHIHFRGVTPKHKTRKGRATINILGLRESDEDRRVELDILKTYRAIVQLGKCPPELLEKAHRYLADAVLPKAKYSAMAQDFLNSTAPSAANE